MIDGISSKNRSEEVFNFLPYIPSQKILDTLRRGRIMSSSETPQEFLKRVILTIFSVEHLWKTSVADTKKMAEEFAEYMVEGYVMPGTPMMTNAGRHNATLSSCALVPVDLANEPSKVEQLLRSYYIQNMGAGFEFTPYDDPVALLSWMNDFSARETTSGQYDRYIGNMGLLHITHPSIKSFMEVKRQKDMPHFNISIDVTEDFMKRVENGDNFILSNAMHVQATELFESMAENAWFNGDPGLIFMERMNRDNALTNILSYIGTPSCAEMGLAKGEACHFGYINLNKFVIYENNEAKIDYRKLERITSLLTRVLDNATEYSISRYPHSLSTDVALIGRKIAIGVCGLADILLAHKLPYDSQEARDLARDIVSFINYISKQASIALAEQRGSCQAMSFPPHHNKYLGTHFLEDKYTRKQTRSVSGHNWEQLGKTIRTTRKLRNIATTALSPSGRSSILLNANASIEPFFSIFTHTGELHSSIINFLHRELNGDETILRQIYHEAVQAGSFQHIHALPDSIRACLKTAKEIAPFDHILMVAALAGMQGVVDESASKTVNLSEQATVSDVKNVFLASYHHGLKNISIYRNQARSEQPELL